MNHPIRSDVFLSMEDFYRITEAGTGRRGRLIHVLNPFPSKPGSEHDRAQRVTLASMTRARQVAGLLAPDLAVEFAKITVEEIVSTPGIAFEHSHRLTRTITDLHAFNIPRPLPLAYDILTALPLAADDILIFTNVDIALMSDFYLLIDRIFDRGVDSAVINRRSISDGYTGEEDMALMTGEVGRPHTGFDCFAMRGTVRDRLVPYEGCVGIAGVMLPLVHMLMARSQHPVVLLDAHATFHIGNDQQWRSEKFTDYTDHNTAETDRVFETLLAEPETADRMVTRLQGAHAPWVFPNRLQLHAGVARPAGPVRRIARRLKTLLR